MSELSITPVQYEDAEVLITVKTYPTPSQDHVETVCVAGVRIDTETPSWVRLYPIPFRALGETEQFKKYQLVKVKIKKRGSKDPRPESYAPKLDTLELGSVIDSSSNWKKRKDLLHPVIGATSTCELIDINRRTPMSQPAPSLGLVKAAVSKIESIPFRDWTEKQREKAERAAQGDLFSAPLSLLAPFPYRVRVHYKCSSENCTGHKQEILDWELGAAGYRWQRQYSDPEQRILDKWKQLLSNAEKDVHLFVGNQHQYRQSFSILGIWYPKLVRP